MNIHAVLLLVAGLLFGGCTPKLISTAPQLHTIDANTTKLKECIVTYNIGKDGNVTVPLDEAMCVIEKLELCEKNCEKLEIANVALNGQIMLLNSMKYK